MSIFGNDHHRDYMLKMIEDYEKLRQLVVGLKVSNHRIVLTIGSWDLLHIGHTRYLLQAKNQGDVLIVGADTDRAIRLYKGKDRPIIPENERCEMLTYQAFVDVVTFVDDIDEKGKWGYKLLEIVRPDVFVAVEDSYPENQLRIIRQHCGRLIVLPRQAEETSTSLIIQQLVKKSPELVTKFMKEHEVAQKTGESEK